jgi:predicted ATPase
MKFKVIPYRDSLPKGARDVVILLTDGWDDWFKYNTMYVVFYYDEAGEQHRIGEVKIGEFAMAADQRRPNIPIQFNSLGDAFFSLGQDDSYYEKLNELGDEFRDAYLTAMCDVARDSNLFARALEEDVTGVSLLRFVSDKAVEGQFRRMAHGGARLTGFSFSYTPPPWGRGNQPPTFRFEVTPIASPPTNVHVLIGRNGVGKTHTLNQMTNALVRPEEGSYGDLVWDDDDDDESNEHTTFPNIISVTFSAFDPFEPLPNRENKLSSVRYQYIGLKNVGKDDEGNPKPPKSPDDLAADFGRSVEVIVNQMAKRERWKRALKLLETDRLFKRAEVGKLIDLHQDLLETREQQREALRELRKSARDIYSKLSSGHKIVLLTITRVVETLEERSLVLVDEPEAHLHPPLLSSFIRTLSDLLINRNGVAIIATHSPVILQEVPKTCVWRIRRIGRQAKTERPTKETFGENVGTLTHAIFGLEVTDSGFHKMISEAVDEGLTYEEIEARFSDQLGDEARGIARSLIATRSDEV